MTDKSQETIPANPTSKIRPRHIIVGALLVLILGGVGTGLFFVYSYFRRGVFHQFNRYVNVMVIGTDDRSGGFEGHADLILVFSYYAKTRRLAVIAVPRNMRLRVNYNSAEVFDTIANLYAVKKDVEPVRKQVETLTGMSIPNYVVVNFEGFREIVDLLGGTNVFSNRLMNYRDRAGEVFIDIPFGHHRFFGKKSLDFVRYRDQAAAYTEFDRIARAMEFCLEMLKKQESIVDYVKQPAMFRRLLAKVKTNLTLRDLFGGIRYLQDFDKTRVTTMVLPGEKYRSYIMPDYEAGRSAVTEMVRELQTPYVGLSKKVDVKILNGSGVPGLARFWQIRLRGEKYNVVEIGNHHKNDLRRTFVLNIKGYPEEAQKIARYIGTRRVYSKIDLLSTADIMVVLGKDAHR